MALIHIALLSRSGGLHFERRPDIRSDYSVSKRSLWDGLRVKCIAKAS